VHTWCLVHNEYIIGEELDVRSHPVSKGKIEERSIGEESQHSVVEFVIIGGRLSVAVVDHEFLDSVKKTDLNNCHWEENWKTWSIQESDEGDVEERRVLVMDVINWSRVEVDVLLESDLLGRVLAAVDDVSVENSVEHSQSPVHEELNNGPSNIEDHCIDHGVANIIEPHLVKVSYSTIKEESKECTLFWHVGIAKEEENSSVEELHNEDSISDETSLFWLIGLSNVHDELNDEESQDVVNSNQHIWYSLTQPIVQVVVNS